jgi:hypothetical protein
MNIKTATIFLFGIILTAPIASAYVSSSTSYRIQSDSINIGGNYSSSTSVWAQDTTGEVGTGLSSSASYRVKAGYQQMQETYLAISSPGNLSLSPAIPSSGGVANTSATWTVVTDNPSGYSLSIRSSSSPALVSGINSFADYTPATADPDYNYSVAAASAEFGFTPEGSDIVQQFKDNGVACNVGALDTGDRCWVGLATTPTVIAQSTLPNGPAGVPLTIKFRAESGVSNVQPAGAYNATATLIVIAL